MSPTKRHRTIRTQLGRLVLVVALPLLGLLTLAIVLAAQEARREALRSSLRLAQLGAAQVHGTLDEAWALLDEIAGRPLVREARRGRCDPVFEGRTALPRSLGGILLAAPDGTPLCSTTPTQESDLVLPAVTECLARAQRSGRLVIGPPFVARATGARVVLLARPVRNDAGRTVATLGILLRVDRWTPRLTVAGLPEGGAITVLDGEGTIIASVPDSGRWVGLATRSAEVSRLALRSREGVGEVRGLDGIVRFYGYTTIHEAGWRVVAGVPPFSVLAPYTSQALRFAIVCLAILVISALFALDIGRRIERPLRALTATARAVADGKAEARATEEGTAETREVAAQFNRMLSTQEEARVALRAQLALSEEARRETKAIHDRQTVLLERVTDGFVALDPDWRITFANETAGRLLGRSPRDLVGRNIWTEFPGTGVRGGFQEACHRALEQQVSVRFEGEYLDSGRWLENRIFPSPDGLTIFFADVTERRRANAERLEAASRLQLAVRAGNVGLWSWDLRTDHVWYSPEWKLQLGYGVDEITSEFGEWETRVHPDDLARARATVAAYLAAPHPNYELECRLRHRDGTYRRILARAEVLKDAAGNPTHLLGCHSDVTRLRQDEETLRRANRALRVLNACDQAVVRARTEAELLPEVCRIVLTLGRYGVAWISFAVQDEARTARVVARAGDRQGYLDEVSLTWADTPLGRGPTGTAIRTGRPCVVHGIATDPGYAPWRAAAVQSGLVSSIALPLVAEGRTLGALTVCATEPDAFDGQVIRLLTELADNLAFGITALRTRAERERIANELGERNRELTKIGEIVAATATNLDLPTALDRVVRGAVELTGLEGGAICLLDPAGRSLRLETEFDDSPEAVPELATTGIEVGTGLCGRCAVVREPIITWDDASGRRAAAGAKAPRAGVRFHAAFPLMAKDRCIGVLCVFARGPVKPTERSLQVVRELCGPIGLVIENARLFRTANRELTERRQGEERERHLQGRLRRAETMSALGSVVASVAHEVRNPLFGISSTLDAFEASHGKDGDHARYLKVLRGETDHLNRLMQDLLNYGRPRTLGLAAVPLRPLVAGLTRACESLAGDAGVTIENRVGQALPSLRADPDLVFVALKNLVENAIHHSPRGGKVVVDAAEVPGDGEGWIRCEVRDSGPGFPEEDLPRIYDPFFSRRAGGTGLGLSIVQRIVEEHGGNVVAGGGPEGGAVVSLILRSMKV